MVTLEYLAGNTVVDQVTLADIFGTHPWQPLSKRVQPPANADAARVRIQINKAFGKFWVDAISAARLTSVVTEPGPIDRMYFSHDGHGHFLYPDDSRAFKVTVETTRELPADKLTASCVLTDYWGAEQGEPLKVQFTEVPGLRNGRNAYEGMVDFGKMPLEIGKYYEIHGEIPQGDAEPYRNFSSFVIEPEAAANSYKASEVPIYDPQLGWANTRDIRSVAPRRDPDHGYLEWMGCQPALHAQRALHRTGAKIQDGRRIRGRERDDRHPSAGLEKYDEKALREGVRNLILTYRKMAEPFIISLGNEPAVNKDWIPADIAAYKAVYEEAKKTDPSVFVVGTSIGPTEEFFKAGFGKYCDAYDLHCYESPQNITDDFAKYKKLFEKYGNPKPIWSTEIGLNSQGIGRNIVAIDMVKKFTLFFAGGGANMSWFDFFYPDPDAKIAGSSGDAHDTMDARYLQYAPKLTAVTYYDLVNSICIKKFVEQKQYGDDVRAFRFRDRDNHQLQVIWKEKGRKDVFLPLAGVNKLQVIRIGGDHRELNPDGKGVTLSVDEYPLLLLYDGDTPLAADLGDPAATVMPPAGIVRSGFH